MSNVNESVDEVVDQQEIEQQDAEQVDPVKNLKSEFSRKFDNTNSKLEALNAQLSQMMQSLQHKPAESEKPLKDLAFEDPDRYAEIIEERAIKRAEEKVEKKIQLSQATTNYVSEMMSKYPELGQPGSDANRMAIEYGNKLPAHLRGTPEGAKLVMADVISELGLVPVSKRNQRGSDDFSLSGQSKPTSKRQSQDPAKDIDPKTLAWMELLDPSFKDDPKRVENLKKISSRKSWTKYE